MIKDKLQDIFRDVFENNKIILRDDMTAADIEEWDSLAHIQLIETIESVFKISFTLQEVAELNNVGEFILLTKKKVEKNNE